MSLLQHLVALIDYGSGSVSEYHTWGRLFLTKLVSPHQFPTPLLPMSSTATGRYVAYLSGTGTAQVTFLFLSHSLFCSRFLQQYWVIYTQMAKPSTPGSWMLPWGFFFCLQSSHLPCLPSFSWLLPNLFFVCVYVCALSIDASRRLLWTSSHPRPPLYCHDIPHMSPSMHVFIP